MLTEPIAVTLLVVDALEKIDVPYVIGGSLASAMHGTARSTLDTDMVVELQIEHVAPLVDMLKEDFYVDEEMILGAIHHQSSFNVVHLDTMFKVDVFIAKNRGFDRMQFQRSRLQKISDEAERKAYVVSAEDIILAKLEWYRMGGEVSDRQWQDILGVLKVQSGRLDVDYLHRWANELKVLDLLQRALEESE